MVRPLGFRGTRGAWSAVTTDGVAQVRAGRNVLRRHGGGTVFVDPEGSFHHLRLDPDRYPATVTTAGEVGHAVALLVGAAGTLARTALDLLRPARYLEALRGIPDLGGAMWEPLVVLLADGGPSAELDAAIEDMRADHVAAGFGPPDLPVEYARRRAAALG